MRRDSGSEVLVAIGALALIAFAITFGIVLSISDTTDDASATFTPQGIAGVDSNVEPVGTDEEKPTAINPEVTSTKDSDGLGQLDAETSTPLPEASATETPTEVVLPSATDVPASPTLEPSTTATVTPLPTREAAAPQITESANTPEAPDATLTSVPTETVVPTETASEVPSATASATATATPTASPSATATLTPTASVTASNTPTASPTATITSSATATTTPTPTATFTSTFTATATSTPTPTATHTATVTPSVTPSATATFTATATATATASRTPRPTETSGILPTPTPTEFITLDGRPCEIPEGWVPYRIQPGNTLFAIARAVGSTITDLGRANCLGNINQILAGADLYVPEPPEGTVPAYRTLPTGAIGTSAALGCANPNVRITSPVSMQRLGSVFNVRGSASLPDLDYFKLEVRPDGAQQNNFWSRSTSAVIDGSLGVIDPSVFAPGLYWIRLVAVDITGNVPLDATCDIPVMFE